MSFILCAVPRNHLYPFRSVIEGWQGMPHRVPIGMGD